VDRPGAIRGISWFHPCILALSDLHDYQQAVLRHQKLTACFAVFIRNLNGDTVLGDKEELSDIQPGMVYRLDPGEDISIVQPPEPATNYAEYCNHHLKSIASAMGITFECLSSDLSNVNFSSGRMGWIEMFRNINSWQSQMLIPQLCEPVWKVFIETAQIYGINTNGVTVNWVPPKREMINPTDEVEALKTEVRSGFVTYSEALRSLGKDPEPHMQEAARDFERLKKLGLKLECDPANEIQKQQSQSQLKLLKDPMNAKT
jgi:lambda family phage portal protein